MPGQVARSMQHMACGEAGGQQPALDVAATQSRLRVFEVHELSNSSPGSLLWLLFNVGMESEDLHSFCFPLQRNRGPYQGP
eukprot:889442-Pelagomonas_calceolata.AAC.2